jgi:hypothetical protein
MKSRRIGTVGGALLLLVLAAGLAGCGKTCPRTWTRMKKCAGEGAALDDDAEAAFRKQCKKLDKKRLKTCLGKEDCADFERCLGKASAPKGAESPEALCQRTLRRGLDCEGRKGRKRTAELDDPKVKELFMEMCRKADHQRLRRCLENEEDCKSFERCAEGAFRDRDVKRRKRAEPDPVPPPPPATNP